MLSIGRYCMVSPEFWPIVEYGAHKKQTCPDYKIIKNTFPL